MCRCEQDRLQSNIEVDNPDGNAWTINIICWYTPSIYWIWIVRQSTKIHLIGMLVPSPSAGMNQHDMANLSFDHGNSFHADWYLRTTLPDGSRSQNSHPSVGWEPVDGSDGLFERKIPLNGRGTVPHLEQERQQIREEERQQRTSWLIVRTKTKTCSATAKRWRWRIDRSPFLQESNRYGGSFLYGDWP